MKGGFFMANSKIIIVEGAQGVGKTTITDFIRNTIPYTNLYRLGGTNDNSITGKEKAKKMYFALIDYMKSLENTSINLLFDRTFFSEEVYCRLGFKEYSFSDVYTELVDKFSKLDFDIYYIALYLSDEDEFERRLARNGKAVLKYAKFNKESSINQQNAYLAIADELAAKYPNIHVVKLDNMAPIDETKAKILSLFEQKNPDTVG